MTYPFVQAWFDDGPRPWPTLGLMLHMAEGGGTVGYLDNKGTPPERGVSVHAVCEYSGRVVQMLDWTHASGSLNPANRSTDKAYYGHSTLVDVLGDYWADPNKAVLSMEIEGHAATGPNDKQVAGIIAWCLDMKARFSTLRGALGHADQTNTKACPGTSDNMKAVFAATGGHGLWQEGDVQAPITDEVPKLVTVANDVPMLDLDNKAIVARTSTALASRPSPYGVGSRRAIYATIGGDRRLVLVTPATVVPVPAPDCTLPVADARASEHEKVRAAAIKAAEAL